MKKFEARNSKFETNSNDQNFKFKTVWNLKHLNFKHCFGFRYSNLGFSLVEFLVVIGIVATIVAFAAVSYGTVNRRARDTKRKGDIEHLRSSLEMYRSDIGSFPGIGGGSFTDASGLAASLVPTYIAAIPSDLTPGQVYRYRATNVSGSTYYGYCLSAKLEGEDPTDTCTADSAVLHNYGTKNP